MKNSIPYIIAAVIVAVLAFLVITNTSRPGRVLDERLTLRQRDKIPYGMSVAKTLLSELFPAAKIYYETKDPGYWDHVNSEDSGQAVVFVANYLEADEDELHRLLEFEKKGNYVFIIARQFSYEASKFFNFEDDPYFHDVLETVPDSMEVRLEPSVFHSDTTFTYPGKSFEGSLSSLDTAHTIVLGRTDQTRVNFVQLKSEGGSFFIHTSPLAFSNYFILHKNNIRYYENALSVIPPNVRTIVWDEYYLQKPYHPKQSEPNWLSIMLQHESFKWGFFTGIAALLLFVLLSMRRKQRMIPVHEKPKNESLDFIKTLGRLYYDRRDHKNLSVKMGQYFLEHVRAKYKISTQTLDEKFIQSLHFKSGYPVEELNRIISFINNLNAQPMITEGQLSDFHKQLELFYQNT